MGCHFLLQGIFLTQGSNLGLPHCRQTLYRLSADDTTLMAESEEEPTFSLWTFIFITRGFHTQLDEGPETP